MIDATVLGNFAYLCLGTNGLAVIDVTNPEVPVRTWYDPATVAFKLTAAKNNTVYVMGTSSFTILDTTFPSAPIELYRRLYNLRDVAPANDDFFGLVGSEVREFKVRIIRPNYVEFHPPSIMALSLGPIQLPLISISGNPVIYSFSGPARIEGGKLHLLGAGDVRIAAYQAEQPRFQELSQNWTIKFIPAQLRAEFKDGGVKVAWPIALSNAVVQVSSDGLTNWEPISPLLESNSNEKYFRPRAFDRRRFFRLQLQ